MLRMSGASAIVLVPKDQLTSRGILPSSQELFELMHLTTCQEAVQAWKEHWMFCPVCLAMEDKDGGWTHTEGMRKSDRH